MPVISLLVPTRINEKFSNFERYLQSIVDNANDIANIEVIFKFDDDQDISEAVKTIERFRKKNLSIKYSQTPRGSGYLDISYFYTKMMFLADESSQIIVGNSIDGYYKCKNFDSVLIEASKKYADGIFVIHPMKTVSFKDEVTDVNKAFQYVENFPCWSRKWIEIQGNFGYNSSSDGYTGLVEYFLYNDHGIDRRIDVSSSGILTESNIEGVGSDFWEESRKKAMQLMLTKCLISFAKQSAKNIAMNIANSWKKDEYINYLIESCLNAYDKTLVLENRINNELLKDIERLNKEMKDNREKIVIPDFLINMPPDATPGSTFTIPAAVVARVHKRNKPLLKKWEKKLRKKKYKVYAALGSKKYEEKLRKWNNN